MRYSLILFFILLSFSLTANEKDDSIAIAKIQIKVVDIYSNEDTNWLQGLANKYHIKTKEHVILNALPFKVGDRVTPFQLKEAERLLRLKSFLRDAKLTLDSGGKLTIEVTESWSLLPTINLNRTGGENSSAFGLRDSNFMGLGISTTLRYEKDHQKSGYRMRISAPLNSSNPSFVNMLLEEYEEGSQQSFAYIQPFYTVDTTHMYAASILKSNLETTFYQNDDEIGTAQVDTSKLELKYGWLHKRFKNTALRHSLGFYDYSAEPIQISDLTLTELFKVREKSYIYWQWEQHQSDYKVLENIFITGNKEDINFGSQIDFKLGLGHVSFSENDRNSLGLIDSSMLKLNYTTSLGHQLNDLLIFTSINSDIELYQNNELDNYYRLSYKLEFFKPISDKVRFYAKNQSSFQTEFRNIPQSLGGDTGLRGFPVQYQYGKKRWLTTLELRYYSNVELWQTFSFAWVGFADFGRAWDNPLSPNEDRAALSSLGIGARIFPLVTSGRHVIHLDLAKPFSDNQNIDSWEWRVQVKNSF